MPELVSPRYLEERIAALEAENARLLAALVEARVHLVCQEIPGAHATQMPLHIVDQALAGDDSALKAMLEKAREEGRLYEFNLWEGVIRGETVTGEVSAEIRDLLDESNEKAREGLRQEWIRDASPFMSKLLDVTRERDSLRTQLAEAERERDIHESVATARQSLLDGIADQLGVAPFSISNIHVAIDKLTAQVERLRDTVEDTANMLRGGKISPQILLADCDERLAETPEQSLEAVLAPYKAQVERLRVELIRRLGHSPGACRNPEFTQYCTGCSVLSETPAASLAAVREQARREALENFPAPLQLAIYMHNTYEANAVKHGWKTQEQCQVCFDKLPESNRQLMVTCAAEVLEWLRDLAAQPAKEPE